MQMYRLYRKQTCQPATSPNKQPEGHSIFVVDFIISAVSSFTSKIPLTVWEYQFDPFMNLSDCLFNFKLVSDFELTKMTKVKSDFPLSKFPPITHVSIVSFMEILIEIDNE